MRAKEIMQPFVLRRLKKDVLKDLPKKVERLIHCSMEKSQAKMYSDVIRLFSTSEERGEVFDPFAMMMT